MNTQTQNETATLAKIEQAAKDFADYRQILSEDVANLNADIERVKKRYMKAIRGIVGICADRQAKLKALIESNPALFEKPKTQIFHGIKVGFRKGTGGITWEDDDQVVKLIKKHFADQAGVLIHTTETPVKKALAGLDVADLKRIGCTVESTGDCIVIKPMDSEIEKDVNALLKDATEEAEQKLAA